MKDINYYHETKFPFKTRKDFTSEISVFMETFVGTKAEIEAKEKELNDEATAKYREYTSKKSAERRSKNEEFKIDLALDNGVEDNPKLDILWNKAWELGHSCGLSEVKNYFEELVELIY